jgi:hypothetical protein
MLMLCVLHLALQIKQREDAHSTSWEGMAGVELLYFNALLYSLLDGGEW